MTTSGNDAHHRLRVCFVTGSYPPERCGVGDYTERLAEALTQRGHEIAVVLAPAGTGARAALRRIPRGSLIHVQYPTIGFGRSLEPLAITLLGRRGRRTLVTLHEFSHAHVLRRATAVALAGAASCAVFTSELERRSLERLLPFAARRSPVIPVGHNIRVHTTTGAAGHDGVDVVYFGLLAPNKGLEPFLELAALAQQRGLGLRFRVLGGWNDRHAAYVAGVMRDTKALPVEWAGPLEEAALSLELRRSQLAYLPFRDGASDRRTSLLAALAHGVPTITTEGPGTTQELRRATVVTSSADETLARIEALTAGERHVLRNAGMAYAEARSWALIAERHEELYRGLVHDRQDGDGRLWSGSSRRRRGAPAAAP